MHHPIVGKTNPYIVLDEDGASFSNPGGLITVHVPSRNVGLSTEERALLDNIQQALILQKRLLTLSENKFSSQKERRDERESLTREQSAQHDFLNNRVKDLLHSEQAHEQYMAKKKAKSHKAQKARARRRYRRRKE
jgi:protein subunit release factor B